MVNRLLLAGLLAGAGASGRRQCPWRPEADLTPGRVGRAENGHLFFLRRSRRCANERWSSSRRSCRQRTSVSPSGSTPNSDSRSDPKAAAWPALLAATVPSSCRTRFHSPSSRTQGDRKRRLLSSCCRPHSTRPDVSELAVTANTGSSQLSETVIGHAPPAMRRSFASDRTPVPVRIPDVHGAWRIASCSGANPPIRNAINDLKRPVLASTALAWSLRREGRANRIERRLHAHQGASLEPS